MRKLTIQEYRKQNKIRSVEAHKQLGISRQHLFEIETGRAYPSGKLISRILEWSDGKINLESLYTRPSKK